MNIPVLVIGIAWLIVASILILRLSIAVDLFRRDADRRGHPREIFTRATVLIGGIGLLGVGILCVVTGVNG